MTITQTPLVDLYLIQPKAFLDERGYFMEVSNDSRTKGSVLDSYNWIQENESMSSKGVLRGMHFQKGEYAQAKLVRVILGEVFDVAVDLRESSPTFGRWFGIYLSGENKTQLLVPRGFAHGFLVISESAIFSYKCDNFYAPEYDSGILYNDAEVGIEWPEVNTELRLSPKDLNLSTLRTGYRF
ncbi:dTDP-4-dehydrorhamnose 3,5-epimerase [Roseivirga sp.]|uniref:dTDP-4-dehydrorhamnose 3,5-epimerase n=1 Tax=Roseivirga sp. TaxID=1964215 RepID=UPI003B8C93A2